MPRFSVFRRLRDPGLLGLVSAIVATGACSLLNAPADVIAGVGGAGGQAATSSSSSTSTTSSTTSASSTTTSSTTSTSSTGTGTGGGPACHVDGDCTAPPGACHRYTCTPAGTCLLGPVADATPCDDGFFCTVGDACTGGVCMGATRACPDGDACNVGACDEQAQACALAVPTARFTETFADNSHGWTLGPEWQIGHATASSGQTYGHPDPAIDYTGEGGVAGVEIGGNADVALPDPTHPSYYLTSPAIDTMIAGSVYLTYYHWLNSDHTPYMANTVEASTDGAIWSVVWQTAGQPTADAAWTFQSIDVTAFKGPATRFRFGFSIGAPAVFTVSSWNLDDVKVQNAPCPM